MTSENTDLPPVPYRPFIRARASLGYPIPVPMDQTHGRPQQERLARKEGEWE